MKYINIVRPEFGSRGYTFEFSQLSDILESELSIDDVEPGDKIVLTVIEMSEAEYSALDEFQGW